MSLMLSDLEILVQADDSFLLVTPPSRSYFRIDKNQAAQLINWLSNHLVAQSAAADSS